MRIERISQGVSPAGFLQREKEGNRGLQVEKQVAGLSIGTKSLYLRVSI